MTEKLSLIQLNSARPETFSNGMVKSTSAARARAVAASKSTARASAPVNRRLRNKIINHCPHEKPPAGCRGRTRL